MAVARHRLVQGAPGEEMLAELGACLLLAMVLLDSDPGTQAMEGR